MRKLRLDLEALAVVSFDTLSTPKAKGTVRGEQASTLNLPGITCTATCVYTCDDATCPACPTCGDSCNGTCAATCLETCGASCGDSCRPRQCGTTIH